MTQKLFTFRIEDQNDRHTRITVFNRGEDAGTLTILAEDAGEFIRRLSGALAIEQSVGSVGAGAKVTGVKIGRIG